MKQIDYIREGQIVRYKAGLVGKPDHYGYAMHDYDLANDCRYTIYVSDKRGEMYGHAIFVRDIVKVY